jgi:hypothetical protein
LRQYGDPVAGVHDGVCPGPGDADFEVPPAAGCPPVMPHSSTVPPWSLMPAATVPACPGAAPPAPRPRPGRRGRMQWLRRFHSRLRSPARRCHPVQASPEIHSLAATAFAHATATVPASVAGPACTTHNGRHVTTLMPPFGARRARQDLATGGRTPARISKGTPAWRRSSGPGQSRRRDSAADIGQRRSTASHRATGKSGRTRAGPPFCADVGLAPIKTKAVQIWESCAHEVHAGARPQLA